jgi:hypothetical protein
VPAVKRRGASAYLFPRVCHSHTCFVLLTLFSLATRGARRATSASLAAPSLSPSIPGSQNAQVSRAHRSAQEEDVDELTDLAYFWGKEWKRAIGDLAEVQHRIKFIQGNYILAMERLTMNRTEACRSSIQFLDKSKWCEIEVDEDKWDDDDECMTDVSDDTMEDDEDVIKSKGKGEERSVDEDNNNDLFDADEDEDVKDDA